MCCPADRFGIVPGVHLRPVPEMGVCLAYTPRSPALHRLNAAAWLTASLCDGRAFAAMADAYREARHGGDGHAVPDAASSDAGGSDAELREAVARLVALGIVRSVTAPGSGAEHPGREP